MSDIVKKVKRYFLEASRADVDTLLSKILLSERQSKVFEMYYLKKKDVGFIIADTLNVCYSVIRDELHTIRQKIVKQI